MAVKNKIPKIYPNVELILAPHEMGVGKFTEGYPVGVTVHYLGSHDVEAARPHLLKSGLGYHLAITRAGKVIQLTYMDQRVNHAGKATWEKSSPNRHHIAVVLASWGLLKEKDGDFVNWTNRTIPGEDVVKRKSNTSGELCYWDQATSEQIAALVKMMRWFMAQGIDPKNICGHDECALPSGRKQDPGGVLPWSMAEFRQLIGNNGIGV